MREPAFYEIIESYHDKVKRFIVFTVKDPWIADDLTQETFIKAQRNIDSLADQTRLKSWLFRIAHSCCMDYFRAQPRNRYEPLDLFSDKMVQNKIAPQKELERAEMSDCVQHKMLMLPPHYRSILWLADAGELSYAEMSDILGITSSNVRTRLHRARKKLKEIVTTHTLLVQ